MFQIIALLSVRKEETEKLEALLKPLLEASRRDAGCLGYDCRADVLNPGTWLFFEKWQDDASRRSTWRHPISRRSNRASRRC